MTNLSYLNNPYHNSQHAADVLQAIHTFVLNLTGELPSMALLSIFVAALIHDYGHPGVNNNFLYKILDPISLEFNGIAVNFF